jgi:hypothetical protein
MKSKIVLFIFLIIILGFIANSVFAEEIFESGTAPYEKSPEELALDAEREADFIERKQQIERQKKIALSLFIILLIVSLVIVIFLMVFMIKHSPKMPNLIIHGFVLLGGVIGFISIIFELFSHYILYGGIDLGIIVMIVKGWPLIFLLFFSGYLTWNLIRKENFTIENKYALSLSSGGIIFFILSIISWFIYVYFLPTSGWGAELVVILILIAGALISSILGIIGFFIDKSHKNSNK